MKHSFYLFAASLIVVAFFGCSDDGKLTNKKAQQLVTQWLVSIGDGAAIATVNGVLEIPQENSAKADINLSNFAWHSPKNDAVTAYVFGPGGAAHNYSGQATAIFIHYNDGRWVLNRIVTPMGAWNDLNISSTSSNINGSNSTISESQTSQTVIEAAKKPPPTKITNSTEVGKKPYLIQLASGIDTCFGTVYLKTGCSKAPDLNIGGWGDWYFDFLQFDLSGAPASSKIVKAELWLYGSAPADPHLRIGMIEEAWTDTGVNASYVPKSVMYGNMAPVPSKNKWFKTDITNLYKWWRDGKYQNFGVELFPASNNHTNGSIASFDNQNSSIRPKLVITLKHDGA